MSLMLRKNYNPAFSEIDDIFEDFFSSPFLGFAPTKKTNKPKSFANVARYPIRTRKEDDGKYRFEFDVPGVEKNDLEIFFDESEETINVSTKLTKEQKDDKTETYSEKTFNYKISAVNLNPESLSAECKNGVLTITGKTNEKNKSKKMIKIK